MNDFKSRSKDAKKKMRKVFPPTPLMYNEHLSKKYNASIWLKREDLSPVRSYKLRGAFNAMRKLTNQKTFVCASAVSYTHLTLPTTD